MNSYKLNGIVGHTLRSAICKFFSIPHTEIYKKVKDISNDGIITTDGGKQYKVILKEINNDTI